MHFFAGFLGASQNSTGLAVRPEVGWTICNDKEIEARDQKEQDEGFFYQWSISDGMWFCLIAYINSYNVLCFAVVIVVYSNTLWFCGWQCMHGGTVILEHHVASCLFFILCYPTSTVSLPFIKNSNVEFAVCEVQKFEPESYESLESLESPCCNQMSTWYSH